MKIICGGKNGASKSDWWIGARISCATCHIVAELEPGDEGIDGIEIKLEGRDRSISLPCPNPTCDGTARYDPFVKSVSVHH